MPTLTLGDPRDTRDHDIPTRQQTVHLDGKPIGEIELRIHHRTAAGAALDLSYTVTATTYGQRPTHATTEKPATLRPIALPPRGRAAGDSSELRPGSPPPPSLAPLWTRKKNTGGRGVELPNSPNANNTKTKTSLKPRTTTKPTPSKTKLNQE